MTRQLGHQIRLEQRAFWRNSQAAFFTFALPLGLLLALGSTSGDPEALLVAGILVFAVITSSYAHLAATIATLRAEGVLKRIRATPLPSGVYLSAQVGSVLVTTALTTAVTLVAARVAFDVRPRSAALLELGVALGLGVTCFAALGLAITAVIPSADSAGPITIATYLPVALVSGVFDPTQDLPAWVDTVAALLPVKALVDALTVAFDPASPALDLRDLVVLAVWTVVGAIVALRTFRWQP